MSAPTSPTQRLGLYALIMIAVVSVDSLRNLPIVAQYGFALITFYIVAALTFFFPLAWIASKLAVIHPNTGGSYIWINAAYGKTLGRLAIWLQWIYNIIWYPTIFAFINSMLATLIHPGLEHNKAFILLTSLGFFWLLSFLHCRGMQATRWISAIGTIIGTLLPMLLIIGLAFYWLLSGTPSATPITWTALIPTSHDVHNLAFFSNVLFSLMGLEVIAMHAGHVINPEKTYPKALGISALLILTTLMLSALSLCIILPAEKIGLINGLLTVFDTFFLAYHIPYAEYFIGPCIVIGGLAIASSWMIGVARGLHAALNVINAPKWIQRLNKNDMPAGVLLFQAVVYSILLSLFLLLPNINNSYWILSALSAQFALVYYVLLFLSAIKLLSIHKQNPLLRYLLPGFAIVICVIGILVGFLPPADIQSGLSIKYICLMITGFVLIGLLPVLIIKNNRG